MKDRLAIGFWIVVVLGLIALAVHQHSEDEREFRQMLRRYSTGKPVEEIRIPAVQDGPGWDGPAGPPPVQ